MERTREDRVVEAAAQLCSIANLPEAFWHKLMMHHDDLSDTQWHMLRTHMVNYSTMLAYARCEDSEFLAVPEELSDADRDIHEEMEGHVLLYGVRYLRSAGSLLVDWREAGKRYRKVHKFQPGKHYHVSPVRFDRLGTPRLT